MVVVVVVVVVVVICNTLQHLSFLAALCKELHLRLGRRIRSSLRLSRDLNLQIWKHSTHQSQPWIACARRTIYQGAEVHAGNPQEVLQPAEPPGT